MSKLDDAWELFVKMREELHTAYSDFAAVQKQLPIADRLREAAKVSAAQIVADAERQISETSDAIKAAAERVEKAQRRVRAAAEKVPGLLHAEVAGHCGKDERADVEKALDAVEVEA